MQGGIGTLTSSTHSVLGPILHFTPRTTYKVRPGPFGFGSYMHGHEVERHLLCRVLGVCSVAHKYFVLAQRQNMRRLDDRWIRSQRGYNWGTDIAVQGRSSSYTETGTPGVQYESVRNANQSNTNKTPEEKSTPGTEFPHGPVRVKTIPRRLPQDGT